MVGLRLSRSDQSFNNEQKKSVGAPGGGCGKEGSDAYDCFLDAEKGNNLL